MKQVQLNRGDRENQDSYTGPEGELTAEMSNKELRLHDGETPGGHRFLPRDSNDERYQKRSVELDGLTGFEPNQRGFLVRLGPSTYRLRTLSVNGDQMVLDNANGYAGNPKIGLAATIKSAHTWTEAQTFTKQIIAKGGLKGDVEGDTKGIHRGNVVGNVKGNLTGDAVGDHSGTFAGSIDTTEGEVFFGDGQILLQALNQGVLDYIIQKGVPNGTVVAFHGEAEKIPHNWFLCDGANGTPDLRDRFILGSEIAGRVGENGGSDISSPEITIPDGGSHTHAGLIGKTALTIAHMPKHKHLNGVVDGGDKLFNHGGTAANPTKGDSIDGNSGAGTREGYTTEQGGDEPHGHDFEFTDSGDHSHSVDVADFTNMPPFYTMAFIMKGA